MKADANAFERIHSNMDKRILWLDIAKGISIFFIVLGHTSYGFLHNFCFSFNSVIFFILSGMSFSRLKNEKDDLLCFDNRNRNTLLKNVAKRLLFPYFVWGSISIAIYYLLEGIVLSNLQTGGNKNFALLPNFIGLVYGNSESGFFEYYRPLWFIPCLVVVEIIWFAVLKAMYRIPRKGAWILYGAAMLLFLLFGIMENCLGWELVLPFEMESAIFMCFFFGVGLLIRSHGERVIKKFYMLRNSKIFILLLPLWAAIAFVGVYMNGGTDTRSDYFGNIGLFIFNAVWISLGIIYIAFAVKTIPFMEYIGKRTLAILVMHKYPIMLFKLVPFIQRELENGNLIIEISVAMVTVLCCLVAERFIAAFLPQLFGQFHK